MNTIDQNGDYQTYLSILNATITSFEDDVIERIGNDAFYACNKLTSINAPNTTSIGNKAFYNCAALNDCIFGQLTSIGQFAFYSCSIRDAIFPSCVTVGNDAFSGCSQLENVKLACGVIDTQTFINCRHLATIELTNVNSIKNYAFSGCSALSTVILRKNDGVVSLASVNAFSNANNAIIYVPDDLVDSYKSATNWSTYADRIKPLSELPAEEGA